MLLNTSSGFKVQEGDNLDIECSHNLPVEPKSPLVFVWLMDGVHLKGKNSSLLTVKKVGIDTSGKEKYACTIQSPCGNFTSEPKEIEVEGRHIRQSYLRLEYLQCLHLWLDLDLSKILLCLTTPQMSLLCEKYFYFLPIPGDVCPSVLSPCLSLCAVSMCVRHDDVDHSDLWCVCCCADPGHGYRHEDHAEDGIWWVIPTRETKNKTVNV